MRKIYGSVSSVFACLGDATNFSDSFCGVANSVTQDVDEQHHPFTLPDELHLSIPDWVRGVEEMTLRAYFSRLWIVQEAVVAGKLWLIIGSSVIAWEALVFTQRCMPGSLQRLSTRSGTRSRLLSVDWL